MAKKANRRTRKIKNLVLICTFSSIMFIVTTYAWFIGMRTVNVSSFDVSIATTDSLLLSLDGKKWDTTVNINGTNYNDPSVVYEGNANSWSKGGLIPMSSVGDMDSDSSRMKLFEKASLTMTAGGYRLMASQVKNNKATIPGYDWQYDEAKGYVAFDLFVKNFSGQEYYVENNEKNEEAIFLTTDSAVTIAADGVVDSGIENSVRVAFAQIGRVSAKTMDPATITAITCDDNTNVTGICRTAKIWEPNENIHVEGALQHYTASCSKRTGANVFTAGAYTSEACGTFETDDEIPTYAIQKEITDGTLVDIYDGTSFNGYSEHVGSGKYLNDVATFTDTDKKKAGNERPELLTLAPNSITKIRVYIYIEGQDIDNNDLASIGKKISVAFGFTKDRFDYEGSESYIDSVINNDETAPVIKVTHDGYVEDTATLTITQAASFDPYAIVTATDAEEGQITPRVQVVNNTVKPNTPGEYLLSYLVSDWAGNYTQLDVKVIVTGE